MCFARISCLPLWACKSVKGLVLSFYRGVSWNPLCSFVCMCVRGSARRRWVDGLAKPWKYGRVMDWLNVSMWTLRNCPATRKSVNYSACVARDYTTAGPLKTYRLQCTRQFILMWPESSNCRSGGSCWQFILMWPEWSEASICRSGGSCWQFILMWPEWSKSSNRRSGGSCWQFILMWPDWS